LAVFNYQYYLPRRAHIDGRKNEICAYLRRGLLSKEDARAYLEEPLVYPESALIDALERLNITQKLLDEYMAMPIAKWQSFKTYRPIFRKTKFLWYLLYRGNVVPKSFYVKYCG